VALGQPAKQHRIDTPSNEPLDGQAGGRAQHANFALPSLDQHDRYDGARTVLPRLVHRYRTRQLVIKDDTVPQSIQRVSGQRAKDAHFILALDRVARMRDVFRP